MERDVDDTNCLISAAPVRYLGALPSRVVERKSKGGLEGKKQQSSFKTRDPPGSLRSLQLVAVSRRSLKTDRSPRSIKRRMK